MTAPSSSEPAGSSRRTSCASPATARRVELAPEVEATILASRAVVERLVAGDRLIYGLNTGLGHMRDHRVEIDVLQRYQRQMIEAHASGIGPPLATADVRAAMLARISGAARGGAGLALETVQLLVAMLNAGVHPDRPERRLRRRGRPHAHGGDRGRHDRARRGRAGRRDAARRPSRSRAPASRRSSRSPRRASRSSPPTASRSARARSSPRRRCGSRSSPIWPARSRSRRCAATRARSTRPRRAPRRSRARWPRRTRSATLLEGSYLQRSGDGALGAGSALVPGRRAGQRRLPRAGDRRRALGARRAERDRRQPDGADRARHDALERQLPAHAARRSRSTRCARAPRTWR